MSMPVLQSQHCRWYLHASLHCIWPIYRLFICWACSILSYLYLFINHFPFLVFVFFSLFYFIFEHLRLHSPSGIVVIHNSSCRPQVTYCSSCLTISAGPGWPPHYIFSDGRSYWWSGTHWTFPLLHNFVPPTLFFVSTSVPMRGLDLCNSSCSVSFGVLRIPWTPIFLWQIIHTSAGICLLFR